MFNYLISNSETPPRGIGPHIRSTCIAKQVHDTNQGSIQILKRPHEELNLEPFLFASMVAGFIKTRRRFDSARKYYIRLTMGAFPPPSPLTHNLARYEFYNFVSRNCSPPTHQLEKITFIIHLQFKNLTIVKLFLKKQIMYRFVISVDFFGREPQCDFSFCALKGIGGMNKISHDALVCVGNRI